MINERYIIDIENYLILIEGIAKKYIHIEDIECCVFSNKLRYPLFDKNVGGTLFREPQMAMYCAPMVKDIIKVVLAKNSFYFKYFILDYKNSYFEDFVSNFIDFFKTDLDIIIPEDTEIENIKVENFKSSIINNFNKDVYNFILTRMVSFKEFDLALEDISNNLYVFLENKLDYLTNHIFIERYGDISRVTDVIFGQERCQIFIDDNVDLFKVIFNSFIKKNGDDIYKINDNGIFNIETIIKNFLPDIQNDELEFIYGVITKMDDDVIKNLPSNVNDYVIEIDDNNIYHILTTTRHILEVRLKETEYKE